MKLSWLKLYYYTVGLALILFFTSMALGSIFFLIEEYTLSTVFAFITATLLLYVGIGVLIIFEKVEELLKELENE